MMLFALLFRTIFPIAYAHHSNSYDADTLVIELCSGSNNGSVQRISLYKDLPGSEEQNHNNLDHNCPFCAAIAQVIMAGSPLFSIAPRLINNIVVTLLNTVRPLSALTLGPPLGSRAPPLFA